MDRDKAVGASPPAPAGETAPQAPGPGASHQAPAMQASPQTPASEASPPAPALEARGLEVPFGSAPGLRDISFRVAPGERFALVGASGAGKTSLLKAISGSGPRTAGSVWVEGRDVTDRPPEKRGMVLLSQRPLLFPHLSVFENVAFPLRVRATPRREIGPRVEEVLSAVRLEGFGPRRPQSLSGGQAHRVALARAVVARPPVLLLDEPLTSLDPALREEVRQAILRVQAEYGPALVLVTHDLQEAGRMASQVGVILEGRLAQVASPQVLFRRPATAAVARFLGLPNELEGWQAEDGKLILEAPPPGRLPIHLDPGPEAPVASDAGPDAEGLPPEGNLRVRIVFGAEAGRLAARGAGGIPARVEEVRHSPEGAVALVTLLGHRADWADGGATPHPPEPPSCIVGVDPSNPPGMGELVEVVFDRQRMHVFGW
jgi:putative spermidine/putrescine transport system ATP-binding protein